MMQDGSMDQDERAAFEKWFAKREWWKENSRREDFEKAWQLLYALTFERREVVFNIIVGAMSDEYGD